jgi:adenylosuccinate lyase
MKDYEHYKSPFSWRYGSDAMRRIWGERHKLRVWRQIWVALAEVQEEFGLVRSDQVDDLRRNEEEINIERTMEIEAEIHHDLMAEVRSFAEQCEIGGGIIHLGATSMDVKDNANVIRMRESLSLVVDKLGELLKDLCQQVVRWADSSVIAFTHLQPAEPTTLGYRLANTAQDLLTDWENLSNLHAKLRGKGLRGAVGTGGSFSELLGVDRLVDFETRLSERLELPTFPVVTQTYPRKQDYELISALAGLGGSLYKFAFDLRILQSPPIGELGEPFGNRQVGSSAMPFKRNPVQAEKINSLARYLAGMPRLAWENAAHSLLERTLDDSANRRSMLPEAFLIVDELLDATIRITKDLRVNTRAMKLNLETYGPFAASERVMMVLVKNGADRQAVHELLREHAMAAWEEIQQGNSNPLVDLVCKDNAFTHYLPEDELRTLMDASEYVGDAPERARDFAESVLQVLSGH